MIYQNMYKALNNHILGVMEDIYILFFFFFFFFWAGLRDPIAC